MVTKKQEKSSKENIKKAQKKWTSMPQRQRAIAQPEGRKRAKPGSKGEGDYYRIVVRDKDQFSSFKTHDVGDKGGIQRITGHRPSGSWDTQAWLISKAVSYTHLRAHETPEHLVCRLLLEKKKL